jgi:hypothetical protein
MGIEPWFAILCFLPLAATVLVYIEAVLASIFLGHWPIPSANDPKDLPTWPLHSFSTQLVMAMPALVVFVGAIALKNWRAFHRPIRYWLWIGLFAAGFGVFWFMPDYD